MAILTQRCMTIPLLAQIVKTLTYEFQTEKRLYEWVNTNKLLGVDFDYDETPVKVFKGTVGCKTGITQSAGACFAGAFTRNSTYCDD